MKIDLDKKEALHILESLKNTGQPPRWGALALNVGLEPILAGLEDRYFEGHLTTNNGRDGGGTSKFGVADHGGGKTLLLSCVQQKAWDHDYVTAFVELSQDECPLDDASKIFAAVARNIQPSPLTVAELDKYRGLDLTLERLLDRRFPEVLSGVSDEELKAEAVEWVKNDFRNTPVDSIGFREAATRHLLAKLNGQEDVARLTSAYLRGEQLSLSDLASIGVFQKLDKSNGFRMLRSMCQLLHRSELAAGTVLLFDEARRSLSLMSVKSQKVACENLLSLINYCNRDEYPGTMFLYAVMPNFFTDFADAYPALQQRCGTSVRIGLQDLGIKEMDLLYQIGDRITEIYKISSDGKVTEKDVLKKNLKLMAEQAWKQSMGSGARRLVAKAWANALDSLHSGKPKVFSENELNDFLRMASEQFVEQERVEVEAEGE